jgi:hypothetical protein
LASSSKKGLGISNISGMLHSDEFVEKLSESENSELSGTSKSSDTDFDDQEDNVLLLGI